MNTESQNFRKSAELLGAICGGLLISLPAIPHALAQQSTPNLNPSPSIFSEPPYNRSQSPVPPGPSAMPPRPVPRGEGQMSPVPPGPSAMPPRPVPRGEGQMSPVPPGPSVRPPRPIPGDRTQQPSPGGVSSDQPQLLQPRQTPSATIALTNGTVNIKLENDTAANVTFQVIGDTAPRSLRGKSNVILQGLKAPVTVTFEREDRGQLLVTPQASSEPGSLEVRFNEATNAAQGRSAMRIERNGSVFLN
ncbi:hypothetical protein [Nostoc sp. 'Peltigera membranacea cyanobiont' 232]|uniref:hypothetical protein n=1 Tax=Nostoc sp. 'Peltigera membranacea cyanobiont' 232 TaxID=2014531 RepID=UPI000B954D67|nr:hypothetical protein [Nostoc sp. 'Peltigera membranacea cyanobiont' 232]OYE03138.1 hypothetical protein CDG79_19960 [Nostoc sp. 'Peltigera membranacea cyanobiont' 232]